VKRSSSAGFDRYWSLLRRRWRAVAAGILLGLVAASLVFVAAPKRYVATCQVLVLPLRTDLTPVSNTGALTVINLDTEAQIVRSATVLESVQRELGGTPSAARLAADISVTAPANTTILELAFPGRTPREAQRGAAAFAHAYLKNRTAEGAEVVAARKRSLQINIDALRTELQRVAPVAEFSQSPVDRALAEARRDLLMRQLNSYTSRFQRISTTPLDPGRIIREPALPTSPESPVLELVGPSGLVAGLLLGLGLAALRDRTDRRLRGRRPAELAPLLGAVDPPGASATVTGPSFEKSRRIANQLLLALEQDPELRVVVVLPIGADPGVLTAQLAVVLARAGRETLLIPTQRNAPVAASIVAAAGEPRLELGAATDLLDDLALADRVRPVLDAARREDDVVLVEAPPIGGSDAQTLASWSDGVIVAFQPGQTRRSELADAVRQLDRVGARVLGSVVIEPVSRFRKRGEPAAGTPAPQAPPIEPATLPR
jgi:capsular polysaccharide biosynthesis protein/Mrp family chromosome partitioning ATPase